MRNCCPGIDLCRRFVKTYESVIPEPQLGDSLFISGILLGGYGTIDLDTELELWFSGLGKVKFDFVSNYNIAALCRLISGFVL